MEYRNHEIDLDWYNQYIEEYYDKALELIKGGKLFGVPVNIENPKEIIASLYILWEVEKYRHPTYTRDTRNV